MVCLFVVSLSLTDLTVCLFWLINSSFFLFNIMVLTIKTIGYIYIFCLFVLIYSGICCYPLIVCIYLYIFWKAVSFSARTSLILILILLTFLFYHFKRWNSCGTNVDVILKLWMTQFYLWTLHASIWAFIKLVYYSMQKLVCYYRNSKRVTRPVILYFFLSRQLFNHASVLWKDVLVCEAVAVVRLSFVFDPLLAVHRFKDLRCANNRHND